MTSLHVILLLMLLSGILAEKHENLELDKPYDQSLDETTMFTGRYVFAIPEENVQKMKGDKWFFFVEVEPNENNEWVSTAITISIGKKGEQESRNERTCGTRKGGIDSCFFTNKQFDYKTQDIHANVRCRGPCKFKISAEVSEPYKLTLGESIEMDFENTAYSKVFQLDTTQQQNFDQLKIILRPNGFLQFPAPIGLYVNKGTSLPTRKSHDFSSITLWDNGEGIFLDTPEAKNIFTILVEGPEQNVLVLETEVISFKDSYEIPETLPHFDYVGEGASKLYKCKVDPSKGLSVFFTTFSGAIKLNRILDAQKSAINQEFPKLDHSYSQMSYNIPASFFKENEQYYKIQEYLLFEIEGVEEATFLFEYSTLKNQIEHIVPEVNRYVELPSKAINQYYLEIVEMNSPDFKEAKIELFVTHEPKKEVKLRFFKCEKEHGSECQLKKSEIEAGKIDSEIGKEISQNTKETFQEGVLVYSFTFASKFFKTVKNDIKEYILGIVVENPGDQECLYTLRYKNIGHNTYLKQMQVQKDRIAIEEQRYYLYTNRQSEIKEIRVHLMEISGRVKFVGYNQDPRTNNMEGQEITDFHNVLKFSNIKENQTIYIKITGKEMAYYSLQVQPMKETQKEWWNRTHHGDRGKFYNQIAIFEDIPYQFTLQPNEKIVYQVHSKHDKFYLEMSSLLPLDLCMTEQLTKPPFSPNCQVKQTLSKRQLQEVILERGSVGNIGVFNNNEKTNKFHIKFYAVEKQEPDPSGKPTDDYVTAKCFPAMLGKVTKQSMKKQTSTCYTYLLPKAEDLELSFDLSNHQFQNSNIIAAVGDIERIEIQAGAHYFTKQELDKTCKSLFPCPLKLFIDTNTDAEVRFTLQYVQGVVFLLDGISNSFSGASGSRYFAYQLVNHLNTTIIVQNRRGSFNFYASVVEANQFWDSKAVHPTSLDHMVKSTNPFYYNYQLAILTEEQIKATKCQECLLLITVEEKMSPEHGDALSKFTIECTQEDRLLKENTPVTSYLNKHSVAFYEFQNKEQGSILITLNTQNRDCASIYVKKGWGRATGSDFDKQSHDNLLLFQNAEQGHYDITVQAKQNCYYSIDFTSASKQIYSTIQPGMYTDVRLDKEQKHSIIYHHRQNNGFRIVTLHQQGEVILNVKEYKTVKDYLDDTSEKKKYSWSGVDFVRVDKDSGHFCYDCYYEIALLGQRQTKTSVIIPTQTTQFPIMIDSLLNQQLKKGQSQKMRIYTDKIVQFEINVQYGSVKVSLQAEDEENDFLFTKTYKPNKDKSSYYETINATAKTQGNYYDYMQFTRVVLLAEEDSGFSFGLISDKDQTKRGNRVKYGIPQYVIIEPDTPECLIGRLDNNDEQFLISITGENQVDLMNNLQISCTLQNGELLELSKEIAKNQMMVKIDKPSKQVPSDYEFCFKSKETIFFTFIQSSRVFYLPETTTVVVNGNMNFSFYSEGKSVMEINECKSRAVTTVFHSFSTDDRVNSEIKQVRRSNNIIEFMYYGPVYVQMQTKGGTIAWRKKDEAKKIGYGYDRYSPHKLRYNIEGDNLIVNVYKLKTNENQALDIPLKEITYSAFLAQEEMNLYDAINCQNGVYLRQISHPQEDLEKYSFQFNVNKILETFGNKNYVLVGALVNATSAIQGDGKYRFIYPYQQIPIAALKGEIVIDDNPSQKPTPMPIPNPEPYYPPEDEGFSFVQLLAILVLIGFAVLIIYRVCLKKYLKRRRMERLSQQGGAAQVRYQQFASYTS